MVIGSTQAAVLRDLARRPATIERAATSTRRSPDAVAAAVQRMKKRHLVLRGADGKWYVTSRGREALEGATVR